MKKQETTKPVPAVMAVQLARLFGAQSALALKQEMSESEWKSVLRKVLQEIECYLEANVTSDDVHMMMLYSGIVAANESLNEKNYWPGYCEGITRVLLTLMGDYPDHRRRARGRKTTEHYVLNRCRSIQYVQDENQCVHTLFAAHACGHQLSQHPRDFLCEFRDQCGYKATYKDFFRWMRKRYPKDYASLF